MAGGNSRNNMGMLAACLAALFIQLSKSAATSYTVGDAFGWATPITNPNIFSTWASHKNFKVGDVLVFDYRMGHTVTEVSKFGYDNCDGSNPIYTESNGPVRVTIKSAGDHYFICTFPGHCRNGQKLAITATSSTPDAASPSPSSTPSAGQPAAAASPSSTPPAASPPSSTPSADASPPPPPKSAGAGGGVDLVLPLLFVVAVSYYVIF